jgi:hypothetical protein
LDYYLIAQVETLDRLFRRMDYLSVQQDLQAKIALTQSNGGRVYVMQDVLEPELCLARYGQWDLSLYASFRDEIFPRLDCFQNDEVQICEVVR